MGEGLLSPAGRLRLAARLRRRWSRVVLGATTLAFVLLSTGLIAVFSTSPAQAHSSTVIVLDGQVLVRHGSGEFASIIDGDTVSAGDTVRTAAGSHGVLTLFDGSTVELEPDTEITVDRLQASASGDKVVEITQAFGRTWHVVTHLVSSSSRYEIKTGASTATVRGTAFEVSVAANGTTDTKTTEGDVATNAQGAEVHVLAGQFTSVTQGSPPPPPQAVPEPAATVTITVDRTQNAIVTDANGRAVGMQNGLPVRYIPGSTVAVAAGKLVVTIPNAQLGVLSTFIKPDAAPLGASAPTDVTVQTQVAVKDHGIVANSLVTQPVENGTARGAVVVTDSGLLLVPNDDAKNAPAPHIGKAPAGPTGSTPTVTASSSAPLIAPPPVTPTRVPAAPAREPAAPTPDTRQSVTPTPPASPSRRPSIAPPALELASVAPAARDAPRVAAAPPADVPMTGRVAPAAGAPRPLDLTTAAFVPFRSSTTTPATETAAATVAVNAGAITMTTPVAPVFGLAPASPPDPSRPGAAPVAVEPAKATIDASAVSSILTLAGRGALSGAAGTPPDAVTITSVGSGGRSATPSLAGGRVAPDAPVNGTPAASAKRDEPDAEQPAPPIAGTPAANRFAPNLAPMPCIPAHGKSCR